MSKRGQYPYIGSDSSRRRSGTDQTTRRLLDAAADEFVERGYDAARVSSIARRAGLTSGAVYARWPAKTEVMTAALEYIFQHLQSTRQLANADDEKSPVADISAAFSTWLANSEEWRQVMVQVFGSARNDEGIRECLHAYLDSEAEQLEQLIDSAKSDGLVDREISTTAMAFLCQAIGVGAELLQGGGLEDRHLPSQQEWGSLVAKLIEPATTPAG